MLDRLREIANNDGWDDDDEINDTVIEMEDMGNVAPEGQMGEFHERMKRVSAAMKEMEGNVGKLRDEYANSLRATTSSSTKVIKQKIGRLIDETRTATKEIKSQLDSLQEETRTLKEQNGNTAEVRIKEQQHATMMKQFVAILQDYQNVQDQFRNDSKDRIERQVKIVNPNATDQEIEELLQKRDLTSQDVFKTDLLTSAQRSHLESIYAEVTETHRDVMELEYQFRDLHEMFVDFSTLVHQQDELVDCISTQVTNALEFVEKGRTHIKTTRKYQKKSRTMTVCVVIAVVIFVAVLLLGGIAAAIILPLILVK